MAAHGEQVHTQLLHGKGNFQKTLHRVGVEEDLRRICLDDAGAFRHRLKGAQLVVDQHHGDQHRVLPQGGAQVLRRDPALPVGLETGHRPALALQGLDGLQHSGVLNGSGNDMTAPPPPMLHRGLDGPVVPLGAAGGEKDLLRRAAQGLSHNGPAFLQPLSGLLAEGVACGRIAECGGHLLQSGLRGLRADGSGSGVVQIDEHRTLIPPCWIAKNHMTQNENIVSPAVRKVKEGAFCRFLKRKEKWLADENRGRRGAFVYCDREKNGEESIVWQAKARDQT